MTSTAPAAVREVARFGMNRAGAGGRPGAADDSAAGWADAAARQPGTIEDTGAPAGTELYLTAQAIGIPESMVDRVVRLFSGRVDFHRDLRDGFDCTVLYEMQFEEGMIVASGRILAVRLQTPARVLDAYLWGDGYLDADGRALGRSFLQSPIEFSRVTSGFSIRRFHPLLKTWRAHAGTDFAAPSGTPVRATAEGVVRFAGQQGGYGNLVIVDHAGGLSSRYGHLLGFAAGIRAGKRVGQGELLAQVGMTGLATGPHLHYELRRAEKPFDPVSMLGPVPPSQLSGERRSGFDATKAAYDRQLGIPARTNIVER
jgi:murein DD-endopeptidase MepM/ murein hydrolase activator NlpD